jgi:hypothetical protein
MKSWQSEVQAPPGAEALPYNQPSAWSAKPGVSRGILCLTLSSSFHSPSWG